MYKQQEQVTEMYRAVGHPTPDRLTWKPGFMQMQANLIMEEARETFDAIQAVDGDDLPIFDKIIDLVDGICDLLYVTYGAAVLLGLDIEGAFNLVHENNMTKVGGERRADGKVLKPPGYVPVNLKPWLEKQS